MRIAVDAMGGDYAPCELVAGTVDAARTLPGISKLFLVGDGTAIRKELAKYGAISPKIEVRHCTEVVGMEESPASAVRRKKDSSISRSLDLVKNGEADAVFSAGNTGAAVAATTLKLRTLEGVERPVIAAVIPSPAKPFILIDAGANPDCTPRRLAQFAVMGNVFAHEIMGVAQPTIGLLSVGTEDSKGSGFTKDAFQILEKSHLNFVGNVEGHDLFEGKVDVIVCDGFVGNVVLKTCEAVAHAMKTWLKEEFTKTPVRMLGALLLKNAVAAIKKKSDPSTYGGAPLLGANGVVIIGHGVAKAPAVCNGIRVAGEWVNHHLNEQIVEGCKKLESIKA